MYKLTVPGALADNTQYSFSGAQMLVVGRRSITSDFSGSVVLSVAWIALLFAAGTCAAD